LDPFHFAIFIVSKNGDALVSVAPLFAVVDEDLHLIRIFQVDVVGKHHSENFVLGVDGFFGQ
jgi:hypothetical protein